MGDDKTRDAKMLMKIVMPTYDQLSDWIVAFNFKAAGDVLWYQNALIIQLLSIGVSGIALATWGCGMWGANSPNLGSKATPLILCGGFAPAVVAYLAWKNDNAGMLEEDLKYFLALELFVEGLPQSTLQSYVGISYGRFDFGTSVFDLFLFVTFIVGMLQAGQTYAEIFRLKIEHEIFREWTLYRVICILYRTAQTTSFVLWSALMYCGFKSGGYWVFGLSTFFYYLIGIVDETGGWTRCRGPPCVQACLGGYFGCCKKNPQGNEKCEYGECRMPTSSFFTIFIYTFYMLGVIAAFYWGRHRSNDYAKLDTNLGSCGLYNYSTCVAKFRSPCNETGCEAAGYRFSAINDTDLWHPGNCIHPGELNKQQCEDAGFVWDQQVRFNCRDRDWTNNVAWWSFGSFYILALLKWWLEPEDYKACAVPKTPGACLTTCGLCATECRTVTQDDQECRLCCMVGTCCVSEVCMAICADSTEEQERHGGHDMER